MTLDDAGLAFIAGHEGCVLHAYPDPGTGGEPYTIGYGHTGGVHPGETCTQAQAMAWLRSDVVWTEEAINHNVRVEINQNQFNALADFVFNVGAGAFRDSTLLRLLNEGLYAEAADQFQRWNKPPLPGILKRREDEKALFLA